MHPVTRQIIGGARKLSAADAFKGLYALQATGRSSSRSSRRSTSSACRPRRRTTRRGRARRSDRQQQPARHLYQFRQPARHVRHRSAPGRRSDGLPMSITLLAAAGKDAITAALARDIQAVSARRSARRAGRCRRRRRSPRLRPTMTIESRWSARICPGCRSTAS